MTQVPSSDLTLPDGVRVVAGRGGLPAVQVDVPACRGEVYLHGAHLTSWRPLGSEVLWMSEAAVFAPGKAIRGGVPICFPWFAGGIDGTSTPAHGFARTTEWGLIGATTDGRWVELILGLTDTAETRALWPYPFTADYRVRMGEDELALLLTVTNTGDEPFTFEEALHSYFTVGDIRSVQVRGLEGSQYLDMVPGARPRTAHPERSDHLRERARPHVPGDRCDRGDQRRQAIGDDRPGRFEQRDRLEPLGRQVRHDVRLRRR